MSVSAHCHWEIGEIVIVNDGNVYVLTEGANHDTGWSHGISMDGQLCMSLDDAKKLVEQLNKAIKDYEHLDKSLDDISKNDFLKTEDVKF